MERYVPYYTLLSRDNVSSPWTIEFGAYDHGDVKAERDDYRDHDYRAVNLMIITTHHTQEAIESRVAYLNRRVVDA